MTNKITLRNIIGKTVLSLRTQSALCNCLVIRHDSCQMWSAPKQLAEVIECWKFPGELMCRKSKECRALRHRSRQVTIIYDIKANPSAICSHLIFCKRLIL